MAQDSFILGETLGGFFFKGLYHSLHANNGRERASDMASEGNINCWNPALNSSLHGPR